MKNPLRGAPNPNDIQRKLEEAARQEVATAAMSAARFYAVGNAPDNSGDLILVGKTNLGLATVAVRMTIIQAMGMASNVMASLANTMQAAHNAQVKADAESTAAKPKS